MKLFLLVIVVFAVEAFNHLNEPALLTSNIGFPNDLPGDELTTCEIEMNKRGITKKSTQALALECNCFPDPLSESCEFEFHPFGCKASASSKCKRDMETWGKQITEIPACAWTTFGYQARYAVATCKSAEPALLTINTGFLYSLLADDSKTCVAEMNKRGINNKSLAFIEEECKCFPDPNSDNCTLDKYLCKPNSSLICKKEMLNMFEKVKQIPSCMTVPKTAKMVKGGIETCSALERSPVPSSTLNNLICIGALVAKIGYNSIVNIAQVCNCDSALKDISPFSKCEISHDPIACTSSASIECRDALGGWAYTVNTVKVCEATEFGILAKAFIKTCTSSMNLHNFYSVA